MGQNVAEVHLRATVDTSQLDEALAKAEKLKAMVGPCWWCRLTSWIRRRWSRIRRRWSR